MTSAPEPPISLSKRPRSCLGQLFRPVAVIEVWIGLALLFVVLMQLTSNQEAASPFWFIDPGHSLLFLLVMGINRTAVSLRKIPWSRKQAAVAFLLCSWMSAMLYELTLSQKPGQFGGMHDTTLGSFVIAQGFYVPLACLGLWLVRRYQLTFYELFFVAGMTGSYEACMFGLPYMLSTAFFLSPVIIAYYFVVYSRFLSTGLLFMDATLLWDNHPRKISFLRKLLYGVIISLIAWGIFVLWGNCVLYLFNNFQARSTGDH